MKKITCFALSFVWASALFSQSAKEIVSRQMEYVNAHMEQGLSFTLTDAMSYVDRYSESYFQEKKNGVIVSSDHNVTVDEKEADFQSTKVFVRDGKVLIESPQEAGLTEVRYYPEKYLNGISHIKPAYRYKITAETDSTWVIDGKKKLITRYLNAEQRVNLTVRKADYSPVSVILYDKADGEPFDVTLITRKTDIRF